MKWGQFSSDHEASNRPGMYEGGSLRGRGRALLPSLSRAHSLGRNVRALHSPHRPPPPILIPQLSLDPLRSPPSFPQTDCISLDQGRGRSPRWGRRHAEILGGLRGGGALRLRQLGAGGGGGLLSHTHPQRTAAPPELSPRSASTLWKEFELGNREEPQTALLPPKECLDSHPSQGKRPRSPSVSPKLV